MLDRRGDPYDRNQRKGYYRMAKPTNPGPSTPPGKPKNDPPPVKPGKDNTPKHRPAYKPGKNN